MSASPREITYDAAMEVSKQATDDLTRWLRGFKQTVDVVNVEANPHYQKIDVDLIWSTDAGSLKLEVKGDRWHKTGNFFFETHSNREKGTQGCFLYTEADYILYYFVVPKIVYVLPVPLTRAWFQKHLQNFQQRTAATPVENGSYTTVGRLVPIKRVLQEVSGVRKHGLV